MQTAFVYQETNVFQFVCHSKISGLLIVNTKIRELIVRREHKKFPKIILIFREHLGIICSIKVP